MNLQNDYKVIYEKAADGKRAFYASKTGFFKDSELITEAKIGEYKLIYEKNGDFYGSTTGIPTEDDYCFEDFRKVFVEDAEIEETTEEVVKDDTDVSEDDEAKNETNSEETVVEEPEE